MKYELNTTETQGLITQTVDFLDGRGIRETIIRHVIDTGDQQVRDALIKLGWRPPGEIAAIDIPCANWNPIHGSHGWRRVTVDDVVKMERQIAAVQAALKL